MQVQPNTVIQPPVPQTTAGPAGMNQQLTREMAQEFEALMLTQLIKQMRESSGGEGLFPGDKSDTYGGMFDMMMANHLAESGGFGFADQLMAQLPKPQTPQEQSPATAERFKAARAAYGL